MWTCGFVLHTADELQEGDRRHGLKNERPCDLYIIFQKSESITKDYFYFITVEKLVQNITDTHLLTLNIDSVNTVLYTFDAIFSLIL